GFGRAIAGLPRAARYELPQRLETLRRRRSVNLGDGPSPAPPIQAIKSGRTADGDVQTCSTWMRAPNFCANAIARCRAPREPLEKSTGTRMRRMVNMSSPRKARALQVDRPGRELTSLTLSSST